MSLDAYDLRTLTSEMQILGAKIDQANSHFRDIKTILINMTNAHVKTNVLLETLIDREKDRYK